MKFEYYHYFGGRRGTTWKPTFLLILSRKIYLRIKFLGSFFFFLMKPQSYSTDRISHEWFSKTANMAEFRGQSQTPLHRAGSIRH